MTDLETVDGLATIPKPLLEQFATGNQVTPRLYYHPNRMVRNFFWKRLAIIRRLYLRHLPIRNTCLDFGCGGVVFFPALSRDFQSVYGVDWETREAEKILAHYHLENVRLITGDIRTINLPVPQVQAITAPDVLEHFADLAPPVQRIHDWLVPQGLLFTSLPTENWTTISSRKITGTPKPFDHYHTAREVENFLAGNGFRRIGGTVYAWYFPMYRISVWEKA